MTREELIRNIHKFENAFSAEKVDKFKIKFGNGKRRKSIVNMKKSELEEVYNMVLPHHEKIKKDRKNYEDLVKELEARAAAILDNPNQSKGYISLKEAVSGDIEKDNKHSYGYENKFKWVINRAKHYQDITGIAYMEILDSWEESRSYWYMNYYQECNQPLLKAKKVRIFDTKEDFKKNITDENGDIKFICPSCGEIIDSYMDCSYCGWASYGLLGCMGKGAHVFIKETLKNHTIFMPKVWVDNKEKSKKESL